MGIPVYVALTATPDLGEWNVLGVSLNREGAQARCDIDADGINRSITGWEQVNRTGDQAWDKAWESRPVPEDEPTLWRVEVFLTH
jgi:hypothetical protein